MDAFDLFIEMIFSTVVFVFSTKLVNSDIKASKIIYKNGEMLL